MRPTVRSGVKFGAVSILALACTASLAQNAPATPEQKAQAAVDLRQSVFKLIGYSFEPVGAMLKRQRPFDADLAQKSAARIEMLAPMIGEAFATDTRQFKVETKAREGIWTNKSDFDAKNNDLIKAAANLTTAAKSGDQKAFTQAAAAVGKACGACHDSFRDK